MHIDIPHFTSPNPNSTSIQKAIANHHNGRRYSGLAPKPKNRLHPSPTKRSSSGRNSTPSTHHILHPQNLRSLPLPPVTTPKRKRTPRRQRPEHSRKSQQTRSARSQRRDKNRPHSRFQTSAYVSLRARSAFDGYRRRVWCWWHSCAFRRYVLPSLLDTSLSLPLFFF